MNKDQIKKLIEVYVADALKDPVPLFLEQEDDELDLGGADDAGGDDLDLGADEGGDLGDEGGELDLGGGDEAGAEGDEGDEDLGDDLGGDFGGGGGGGLGAGGGFGGDDDFGDAEDGEAEEEAEGEGDGVPAEVDLPDDPIQAAVDIAINMLEETGDDNRILSAVKASIQQNFDNFSDAVPIITSLWETEHPILKVVARKLLLFIQGR